jgi:hypothetical protein
MTAPDVTISDVTAGDGTEWVSLAPWGYGKYEIDRRGGQGRDQRPVRSIDRAANGRQVKGTLLKVSEGSRSRPGGQDRAKGYLRVYLYPDEGKPKPVEVHALVMLVNVGPLPEGMQTRHLDSDPWNNRWEPGDEETTRKAGGNLIYGTGPENHADQVKAGTATRPEYPCAGKCGGTASFEGARCRPCMIVAGRKAAGLLNDGVPLSEVTRRCDYKSESWTFAAARDFGGYGKTTTQARHQRRQPLLRRVTAWLRRKGER